MGTDRWENVVEVRSVAEREDAEGGVEIWGHRPRYKIGPRTLG